MAAKKMNYTGINQSLELSRKQIYIAIFSRLQSQTYHYCCLDTLNIQHPLWMQVVLYIAKGQTIMGTYKITANQ